MMKFLTVLFLLLASMTPVLASYTPLPTSAKIFVEANGSDANSGLDQNHPVLTITNAITKAQANGINFIKVGVGQFWISNSFCVLPVGMELEGSGDCNYMQPFSTLAPNGVTSFVLSITNGTAIYIDPNSNIQLSDNTILGNCMMVQPLPGDFPLETVGGQSYGVSPTVTTTNCTIHDITFYSDFIHAWVLDSTNVMQIRASNCKIYGGGQTCDDLWFGPDIGGNGNSHTVASVTTNVLELHNVYLGMIGSRVSAAGRGLLSISCPTTLTISGGTIECTNPITSASQPYAILLDSSNIVLNLSGTSILPPSSYIQTENGFSNETVNVMGNCIGVNRILVTNSVVNYPDSSFINTPLLNTIYVEQNGSDNNSGLDPLHPLATLTNALAVAEAANIMNIHVGYGYYYLTNLLILTNGMKLEGSGNGDVPSFPPYTSTGPTSWYIASNCTEIALGQLAGIRMSDNTVFEHCLLYQTHQGAYPIEPVGGIWGTTTSSVGAQGGFSNLTTTNCTINDDTIIGIYWYSMVFDATNAMQVMISNCHIWNGGTTGSGFILGNYNTSPQPYRATNNIITLRNDYFKELGDNSTTPVGQIVCYNSGTLNIEGGTLNTTNGVTGASQQYAIHLYGTNTTINLASAGIVTPPGIAIQDDGSANFINVYGNCITANRIYAPLSQVYYADNPVLSLTNLVLAGTPAIDGTSINAGITSATISSGASPVDMQVTLNIASGGVSAASLLLTISNSIATQYPIDYIDGYSLVSGNLFHGNSSIPSCSNWVNSAGMPCVTLWSPASGSLSGNNTYTFQIIGQMRYGQ